MLVGRSGERSRIDALLAGARGGASAVLVLQGEAGVGKSALLDYARDQARAMTQLRVSGMESEAELAFAGLTELLRPVTGELEGLPAAQGDALRRALALEAEPANPLAVRVALLTLLATLAEAAPVLVTVDDAQWVDESSMAVLAFAARRLTVERVAVVVASRDDDPVALGVPPDARVVLGGLSDDEARELVADRSGLTGPAADQLLRVAAGNPLALLELPSVPGGLAAPPGVRPPPVGPRVQEAFQHRLDQLAGPTRLALGLVAADGTAGLGEILQAFGPLGLDLDVLEPAERQGLVTIDADRVALRHPLLRSVAYHALAPPERRRVHGALAAALDGPGQVERRTWHQASAALGPDEAVARALDEVARAAERRGALATAAHGYDRAASLSADGDARARRLLASAEDWLGASRSKVALDQLEQAAVHAHDPGLRADVAASTGLLEAYRSGPDKGATILVEAAERIEADDPQRATRLYTYAVNVAVLATDAARATELADRAVACGARAGGLSPVSGAMARVQAGLLVGDGSVEATLAPLAELAEGLIQSDLAAAEHVFSLLVLADFVLERWDRAERLLEVMLRRANDTGRVFLLAVALAIRGEIEFRRGRWPEAYATVTTDVWDTLDLPGVGSLLRAEQARVEAGLGHEAARAHAEAALAAASRTGTHAATAWAGASLGFLELGRDRPGAAVEHLEAVAATFARGGVGEPGILWWAADLVEAHWRVGDVAAARRHLDTFQAQADATGRRWARATAARAAGLLATTPDEMEAAFAAALRGHDLLDTPFERARTLLLLGRQRRRFDRDGADGPLAEALVTFERLAARPWIAQARDLLGDRPQPQSPRRQPPAPRAPLPPSPSLLTRHERQVAALVGRGATNREAAKQLFVSPRTIDFHLRKIYRKLQIRSRTELAVHITAQGPPPLPSPPSPPEPAEPGTH